MKDTMNLQQTIYNFLAVQIEFGAYRFRDPLPSIEEACRWFSVSPDTIRFAYLRLKNEGAITLTKKAGAAVAVQYNAQEIEEHIQTFFSLRRDAALDLCRSLGPLFNRAQWLALKNIRPEQLEELEQLCLQQDVLPTYTMLRHVHLLYSALNNNLLLRLVWQAFLFFQGPFISLPQNIKAFEDGDRPLLSMIRFCRQKDWDGLWLAIEEFQAQLSSAISRFYADRIAGPPKGQAISFHWNAYEKSSQRCYSLALELMKDIRHGVYPEETFLPPPAKMAETVQVSVITIRRTLALLNQLGVTQSINGVGTQVLKAVDSEKNCSFSQPILQKRLSDCTQSLQILALTCKDVLEITLASEGSLTASQWAERLLNLKQSQRYEMVVYSSLELISQYAPVQAIREIYAQLLQILLWGYPLRSMHGSREALSEFYLPFINSMAAYLEQHNGAEAAAALESLLCQELSFAVAYLKKLGISPVPSLVIPER